VVFRDATIGYQTHGMSIGSLKTGANVSNILFEDVTVATGLYAARFKSWANNTVGSYHSQTTEARHEPRKLTTDFAWTARRLT
jgi:polygalacturonase